MQPDTTLTAEELACCKQMNNDCGDMGGQSSGHDCCKKADIRIDVARPQQTNNVVGTNAIDLIPTLPIEGDETGRFGSLRPSMVHGYSPPESPPPSIQVLRI
jgi:hypothetical protein